MMRVDLGQKIPIHSSSRDEGLHGESMEACPTVNLVPPYTVVSRVLQNLDTSTVFSLDGQIGWIPK
jgi:hypothetical protein